MKKVFLVFAIICSLCFVGCDQPTNSGKDNDKDDTSELSLTIKNQSSYSLSDVRWSGKSFASDPPYLNVGSSVKQNLTEDESSYITFRYVVGSDESPFVEMALRTSEFVSSDTGAFTFTDNTVVRVVAAPFDLSNVGTLDGLIRQLGSAYDAEKEQHTDEP
jgi:hypothetical protein